MNTPTWKEGTEPHNIPLGQYVFVYVSCWPLQPSMRPSVGIAVPGKIVDLTDSKREVLWYLADLPTPGYPAEHSSKEPGNGCLSIR